VLTVAALLQVYRARCLAGRLRASLVAEIHACPPPNRPSPQPDFAPPAPVPQDGHVYVVETNPLLRPLLREAARSCINPNMWFMESSWARGALTNAASHRRLFLPAHQPNRRCVELRCRGYRGPTWGPGSLAPCCRVRPGLQSCVHQQDA
jgi:hypothetical protein